MNKNTVNLTNCVANLEIEHENYRNGRLSIIVEYKGKYLDPIDIKIAVLKNAEAAKKIENILDTNCMIDFTEDDCKKICEEGRKLIYAPVNVAQKMEIRDVVRAIYEHYLNYCKKNYYDVLVGEKTSIYIRENKGIKYLGINYYKALQDILNAVNSGWKATELKKMAIRVFDLWENGDQYHRGLYQNRGAKEEWSIRIPLDTILTKEEVERFGENAEELEEVA